MKKINLTIILVRPQLCENIGMTARAMDNFGFSKLSIVNPKGGWPSKKAKSSSKHAYRIINILTFDDKGLFRRKLIKCLIYPLKLLMKLRIKFGFYNFFIDLVLFNHTKKYVRKLSWFRTNILGNVEIRKIKSDAVFAERVGGRARASTNKTDYIKEHLY